MLRFKVFMPLDEHDEAAKRNPLNSLLALLVVFAVPALIVAGVILGIAPVYIAVGLLVVPAIVIVLFRFAGFLGRLPSASSRGVQTSFPESLELTRRGLNVSHLIEAAGALKTEGITVSLRDLGAFEEAGGQASELADRIPQVERRRLGWDMRELIRMQASGFDVVRALDQMCFASDGGRRLSFADACESQMSA